MGKYRKILIALMATVFAFAMVAFTACGDENEVSITLNKTTLTLNEGASETLTATVEGSDEAVVWSYTPNDGTVITIAENDKTCTVTAVAEGTAKVTATVGDVSVECAIMVKVGGGEEPGDVTVTLDNETLTLDEGASGTLTATVEGSEDAVVWAVTPSGESVIKIEGNGKTCNVTAVAEGTVKVTATVGDVSAECSVTVNPAKELPNITEWADLGTDAIYNETDNSIWHHLYFNDVDAKAYDFDGYEVTVKLDGDEGVVIEHQAFDAAAAEHAYHLRIQIQGNKYQTAVFSINFKKGGETVATGEYTRIGDREIVLNEETLSISKDATGPATVSIIRVNGSTDLTGLTIAWTIADIEGEGVATIPESSNGSSVEITAVAVGKAMLTCTIGEGEGAFSTTCAITVVAGQVVEEQPTDVSNLLVEQEVYGEWNINIKLDCDAELGGKIASAEVTATMDGESANVTIHEIYGTNPKYIKMGVTQNWKHTYVFTINYKNVAGKVIATGTFTREAEKSLELDVSTLNLELGVTASGTITATVSNNVTGKITWTIDGESIATIVDNEDGTVTVTAVAKGEATITASVDGLTKTCTVNVVEEGETVAVPTITDIEKFSGPYGDGRFYQILLKGTDKNASKYANFKENFDHTNVDGAATDHKEFFEGGGVGCYIVVVHFASEVVAGTTYKIDLCNANGDVIATLNWTAE